jgi:hypothetical protein
LRIAIVSQWEHRKGWDILLDAFWSEFGKDEPVELMLITYVPSWEHGPRSVEVCARLRATVSVACWKNCRRVHDLLFTDLLCAGAG